ncbi:hypothetical protein [Brachyspira alvinipulli]|uniref:hypothetical protein n=1 Tax=Brachyspira alvinipulli TaxID=84379 RepID=UPI000488D51F|nr:hypothetical protein [Brachyspira alvinipulli]
MLVKEFKKELENFEDDAQIFVRVKDEKDRITLADFGGIITSEELGLGVIVPLFKVNKEK